MVVVGSSYSISAPCWLPVVALHHFHSDSFEFGKANNKHFADKLVHRAHHNIPLKQKEVDDDGDENKEDRSAEKLSDSMFYDAIETSYWIAVDCVCVAVCVFAFFVWFLLTLYDRQY